VVWLAAKVSLWEKLAKKGGDSYPCQRAIDIKEEPSCHRGNAERKRGKFGGERGTPVPYRRPRRKEVPARSGGGNLGRGKGGGGGGWRAAGGETKLSDPGGRQGYLRGNAQ